MLSTNVHLPCLFHDGMDGNRDGIESSVNLITSRLHTGISRVWVPKFATGLIYQIEHSSKSIWVTRLLFCQNNSLMGGSFWPKDSLITFIIFELCLIWCISPVANFGTHPLICSNLGLIYFYIELYLNSGYFSIHNQINAQLADFFWREIFI